MFTCDKCDKMFSTKHILSSHRTRYHRSVSPADTKNTIDPDIDNLEGTGIEQSDHECIGSAIDQLGSESSDSNGTDNEVEDTTKDQDESSTDESKADSDEVYTNKTSRFGTRGKESGRCRRKQRIFRRRSHPYQSKRSNTAESE